MPNFLALAFQDPFDLAGSLRIRFGLFKEAEGGVKVCEVRRPREDGKFGVPAYAATSKWPELNNMLQRLKRLGDQTGGIDFGRIDLVLLPAAGCMDWARPPPIAVGVTVGGEGYEGWKITATSDDHEHAIMMLRVSPGVVWFAGAEVAQPAIGVLTAINRRVPRSAINMGESAAIWLAIDFRRREETK